MSEHITRRRVIGAIVGLVAVAVFAAGAALGSMSALTSATSEVSNVITLRENSDGVVYVSSEALTVDYNPERMFPRGPNLVSPFPSSCPEALSGVSVMMSRGATLSQLGLRDLVSYEQFLLIAQHLCTYDSYVEFATAELTEFADIGVSLADVAAAGTLR